MNATSSEDQRLTDGTQSDDTPNQQARTVAYDYPICKQADGTARRET